MPGTVHFCLGRLPHGYGPLALGIRRQTSDGREAIHPHVAVCFSFCTKMVRSARRGDLKSIHVFLCTFKLGQGTLPERRGSNFRDHMHIKPSRGFLTNFMFAVVVAHGHIGRVHLTVLVCGGGFYRKIPLVPPGSEWNFRVAGLELEQRGFHQWFGLRHGRVPAAIDDGSHELNTPHSSTCRCVQQSMLRPTRHLYNPFFCLPVHRSQTPSVPPPQDTPRTHSRAKSRNQYDRCSTFHSPFIITYITFY